MSVLCNFELCAWFEEFAVQGKLELTQSYQNNIDTSKQVTVVYNL